MPSHLIVRVDLDLRELDMVMQNLPANKLKSARWIVTTADMQELTVFHGLWAGEATILACHVPPRSDDVEECVDIIVENELRPDESVLVLHGPECQLLGALGRYPDIERPHWDQAGNCARPMAKRVAARLDVPLSR